MAVDCIVVYSTYLVTGFCFYIVIFVIFLFKKSIYCIQYYYYFRFKSHDKLLYSIITIVSSVIFSSGKSKYDLFNVFIIVHINYRINFLSRKLILKCILNIICTSYHF